MLACSSFCFFPNGLKDRHEIYEKKTLFSDSWTTLSAAAFRIGKMPGNFIKKSQTTSECRMLLDIRNGLTRSNDITCLDPNTFLFFIFPIKPNWCFVVGFERRQISQGLAYLETSSVIPSQFFFYIYRNEQNRDSLPKLWYD